MVAVSARRLSPVSLNAVDYGLRAGASSATLKAALAAALAALPAAGGTISLPAGTFDCGAATSAAILTILRSNVAIRGAGIGQTIIQYDSTRAVDGSLGPGSCFMLGQGDPDISDITITDMTIQDLRATPVGGSGHNPSAIDCYGVDNVLVERVECIDIRGNGAITAVLGSGRQQAIAVRDSVIRGGEGDGINVGGYDNVRIERNLIIGPGRHGIEGGGNEVCHIDGNTIDMLGVGLAGIGTATFSPGTISNNIFRNLKSDASIGAIVCSDDLSSHASGSLTISGNVMESATTNAKFLLWQIAPDATPGSLVVVGNLVQSRIPISILGGLTYILIEGNTFDVQGSLGPLVGTSGAGNVLGPGEYIVVRNNVLSNVQGIGTKVFHSFATATNWKSAQVRASGNMIGASHNDARSGQADGGWAVDNVDLASIANGAASPVRSVSMPGALPGDVVTCAVGDGQVLPSGTFMTAHVSAADAIEWQLVNFSGGAVDPGTLTYHFAIERH